MASLRKRKGSNVWWAQYYVRDAATGILRQIRKSTGQTNKKKAMADAVELERTAQGVIEAGSDKARKAKSIFADVVAEIDRQAFTVVSARKHLASLLEITTGEGMPAYTVETWGREWLARKSVKSSKATKARYEGHLESFLRWLGDDNRGRPIESVTMPDARRWRESLLAEGRAGKTVLSYLKDLGAVYRAAIREGLVNFNPFASAIADVETGDSLERKPFTLAEVGRLVDAAPTAEWRGLVLVGAFTGLRLGDAARLKWDSIDLQAKTISLVPSKTKRKGHSVTIPIAPDLLAFFESSPVADDSPAAPVFPTLAKTPIQTREGLSAGFVGLMAAADVGRGKASRDAAGEATKGRGRVIYEKGFHSLRHTFTTWLRKAGVSEEDRMALTGHATRESHSIYSHSDEGALRKAVAKLPRMKKAK